MLVALSEAAFETHSSPLVEIALMYHLRPTFFRGPSQSEALARDHFWAGQGVSPTAVWLYRVARGTKPAPLLCAAGNSCHRHREPASVCYILGLCENKVFVSINPAPGRQTSTSNLTLIGSLRGSGGMEAEWGAGPGEALSASYYQGQEHRDRGTAQQQRVA